MSKRVSKKVARRARTIPHDKLYARWRREPAFQKARAELADEFALVAEFIRARRA